MEIYVYYIYTSISWVYTGGVLTISLLIKKLQELQDSQDQFPLPLAASPRALPSTMIQKHALYIPPNYKYFGLYSDIAQACIHLLEQQKEEPLSTKNTQNNIKETRYIE